jgi:hypothetical protein
VKDKCNWSQRKDSERIFGKILHSRTCIFREGYSEMAIREMLEAGQSEISVMWHGEPMQTVKVEEYVVERRKMKNNKEAKQTNIQFMLCGKLYQG